MLGFFDIIKVENKGGLKMKLKINNLRHLADQMDPRYPRPERMDAPAQENAERAKFALRNSRIYDKMYITKRGGF